MIEMMIVMIEIVFFCEIDPICVRLGIPHTSHASAMVTRHTTILRNYFDARACSLRTRTRRHATRSNTHTETGTAPRRTCDTV